MIAKAERPPNGSDFNLWAVPCDPRSGVARGAPSRLTSWTGITNFEFSQTRQGETALVKISAQHQVYVASFTGGSLSAPVRATLDDADDTDACWSLDSRAFAYASNRRGNFDIYLQRIGKTEADVVSAGPEDEISPRFDPSGRSILFGTRTRGQSAGAYWRWITGEIRRVEPSGGGTRTLARIESGRAVRLLSASHPGARCILAEWTEKEILYSSIDPSTGKESFLLRLPRAGYWLDAVSPDGRRLARYQGVAGKVQIVDLDARSAREIEIQGENWIASAAWTQDGSRLVLSAQRPDGWAILSSDLSGSAHTLWKTRDRWYAPRFLEVSPDGERLLFDRLVTSGNVWMLETL